MSVSGAGPPLDQFGGCSEVVIPTETRRTETAFPRFRSDATSSAQTSALEPDSSASDRAPNGTQNPQNHTDEHENAADCVQNWDTGEIADQQQNNSQDDHVAPLLLNAV